jgi:hypothetical protein
MCQNGISANIMLTVAFFVSLYTWHAQIIAKLKKQYETIANIT